jgi:hypothetical protein
VVVENRIALPGVLAFLWLLIVESRVWSLSVLSAGLIVTFFSFFLV